MQTTAQLVPVQFSEHPHHVQPSGNDLDIVLPGSFSIEAYCGALFNKLLHIGLSESTAFLNHHCSMVSVPVCWLNSLEKLIKLNVDLFKTKIQKHRHIKFITEISFKRNTLISHCTYHQKNLMHEPDGHQVYSFSSVKCALESLSSLEQKLIFLNDQIFDYRQNPPIYVKVNQTPFDILCQIEIDRLTQRHTLQQKMEAQKTANTTPKRLPFNGELKVLCDVFYKMMRKKTKNGKTMLPWNITQTTEHICNNYCEPDGSPLSPSTVRTYLSPSRPESRPKSDAEINLDD
ncbi:MAG: hypothetical protein Q8S18_06410 [Bacteroidales bacterium]|nr:hypothetical protein [Bacteroidales bacterium]